MIDRTIALMDKIISRINDIELRLKKLEEQVNEK